MDRFLEGIHLTKNTFLHEAYAKLHEMSEVGFEEFKTSAWLAQQLKSMGYEVTPNIGTTGLIGVLDSGCGGPDFGLRADMDALPFNLNGKDIAIHACGHDANSAMVLTAAKIAAERGICRGRLFILFQQAEERAGAVQMVDGVKKAGIQELVGLHLRPSSEALLGQAIHGLSHGAGYFISLIVAGSTSHGARAHLGVNALDAAVGIVCAVNAMKLDATIPSSVKATQIWTSGNAKNSIPDTCHLTFDVRSQQNDVVDRIIQRIKALSESVAAGYGASVKDFSYAGMPAANLDPELLSVCERAVVGVLGGTLGARHTVGGEDIHYFHTLGGVKIGYIGIGANLQKGLHHPEMTFDHDAMDVGLAILLKVLEEKVGLKS